MADLAIQAVPSPGEELIGANHPTKPDSLNRLFIAGGMRATDGSNNWLLLNKQTADPDTGEDQIALYCKDIDGEVKAVTRKPNNGEVKILGGLRIRHVQSGYVTGTMTTQYHHVENVTLSGFSDLSKMVVYVPGAQVDSSRPGFKAKLTSASNLELILSNYNDATNVFRFYYRVVEYENASVQRGEISSAIAGGATTGSVTISNVDVNASFSVFTGVQVLGNLSTGTPAGAFDITAATSLGYVIAHFFSGTQTVVLPWQIVTIEQ